MKHYVILKVNEITPEMIKASNNPTVAGLRFNTDNSKAVLSFDVNGHVPFLGFSWLVEDEVKIALSTAEWNGGTSFIGSFISLFKSGK